MTLPRHWSLGHVVRIDRPEKGTRGWQARMPHVGDARRYQSRYFADQKWGGKRMARVKARQWLQRLA